MDTPMTMAVVRPILVGPVSATIPQAMSAPMTRTTAKITSSTALALAIGRVGCFLSELPLGTPTDLPWGMTISPEAAASFPRCPGCGGPMHPSMLYEIGFHLAAFGLIVSRGPLLPIRGDTLKAYLLAYGIFRFGVEFVRGNEVQAWGLTGPQLVLIPLIGLLVVHFVRRLRSGAYRLPMPEPAIARGG